jgi:cGMP-dependent protein kinase
MGLCASAPAMEGGGGGNGGGNGGEQKVAPVAAEARVKAAMHVKRRVDIFSQGFNPSDTYDAPSHPKKAAAKAMLEATLKNHFLFSSLTDDDRSMVIDAFEPETVEPNQDIITQGDVEADWFYILESGQCSALKNGRKVKTYPGQGSFGELALLYSAPRAASIRADTQSTMFKLDRETFRHALAKSEHSNNQLARESLSQVKMLDRLSPSDRACLADAVKLERFPAGQLIIAKGAEGNVFYMILKGTVEMTEIDGEVNTAQRSKDSDTSYFGELALIKNAPRSCSVTAKTDVDCLALNRADFLKMLGPLQEVMKSNFCNELFKTMSLFEGVPAATIKRAATACKIEDFAAGSDIITQGDEGDKFYVISEGQASVLKDDTVVSGLEAGKHFGEQALLNDPVRNATIKAITRVRCFTLSKETFDEIKAQGSGFQTTLDTTQASREQKEEKFMDSLKMRDDIAFEDLRVLAVLGTGTFGRVKLVQYQEDTFALKIMQKAQVVEYRQQQNVMHEKNVMVQARHPFILKLVCTYQDQTRLYMLMELCLGGELFSLLHYHGGSGSADGLDVGQTRFYSSCVLDGLAYLHSRKICYRDLKPENLLIDDEGYIKIVDFGFAKVIEGKSYTLCGTPEYLAPEIVLAKGHNKGVDYWALGVLIYEMRHSYSPFAIDIDVNDHVAICKNIVKNQVKYPPGCSNTPCAKLIGGLLTTQPHMRLGCMAGAAGDIKNHEFYRGFDWVRLLQKEIQAPWIPKLKSKKDTAFFEPPDEPEDNRPYEDDGTGWDKDF